MKNTAKTTGTKWMAKAITGLAVVVALTGAPALARADIFAKIGELKSDSTTKGKEGQFTVESFSMGVAKEASAGAARRRGDAQFGDIELVTKISSGSPQLFLHSANGAVLPQVIVTFARRDRDKQSDYLVYTLDNCLVTSYKMSGDAENTSEQISLSYEKIKMTFVSSDQTGKTKNNEVTWDRSKN